LFSDRTLIQFTRFKKPLRGDFASNSVHIDVVLAKRNLSRIKLGNHRVLPLLKTED
jgi:hypothetical protein